MVKVKESKIPDLTTEIAQRVEANADALTAIGVRINSRMDETITRSRTMSEHYVYAVFVEKKLKYIGKGKNDRFKHGASGCSHVFGLNECYFEGKLIEVGIVREGLTDKVACELEVDLIWGLGSAEDIALYNIQNGPSLVTTYPNMTEEEFYNECRIVKTSKYVKGQYCMHPVYSDKNRGEESTWRRI